MCYTMYVLSFTGTGIITGIVIASIVFIALSATLTIILILRQQVSVIQLNRIYIYKE